MTAQTPPEHDVLTACEVRPGMTVRYTQGGLERTRTIASTRQYDPQTMLWVDTHGVIVLPHAKMTVDIIRIEDDQ